MGQSPLAHVLYVDDDPAFRIVAPGVIAESFDPLQTARQVRRSWEQTHARA